MQALSPCLHLDNADLGIVSISISQMKHGGHREEVPAQAPAPGGGRAGSGHILGSRSLFFPTGLKLCCLSSETLSKVLVL